jgi:hypothetical protein
MTLDPSMRASDADRERAADRLRDAHAEGRLTREEFDERIDRTFAAKTLGELAGVTQDLPAVSAALQAPVPAPATPYAGRRHLGGIWASWGSAVVVCVGIWATSAISSGDLGNFWPIWVAGPWGAVLLARSLFGAERERPGRQDGERDDHP